MQDASDLIKDLKKENLIYITDEKPGFVRKKNGTNFIYFDTDGKKISDDETIERIESLSIPPAWHNVWICPSKNGYLQAAGFDDRNRKQYIYHPDWIEKTQENKFSKMADFGKALPKIRKKVSFELRQKELNRERVIATVIWLLEHTFIRIGNEEYARENNSFGLTTLRNRHAKVRGSEITFHFRGKSGVENVIEVTSPAIVRTIKECIELPGYELFRFIDDSGQHHVVDSKDVNEFLQNITNDDFSAKDFRTWGATNLSAMNLYKTGQAEDEKEIEQNIVKTVKKVAEHLNNTADVCKTYYIHPEVIAAYSEKRLIPHFDRYKNEIKQGLSWNEYALIKLLK